MTDHMINPQPNYSGVTIQISNPAVYADGISGKNCYAYNNPMNGINKVNQYPNNTENQSDSLQALPSRELLPQNAYPAQYYLNNYNYQGDLNRAKVTPPEMYAYKNEKQEVDNPSVKDDALYNIQAHSSNVKEDEHQDFSKSNALIKELDERAQAEAEAKKNTKTKNVVVLTDEYIKSLENYLNNPNDEIRLMASKEILVRLDEDKTRFDDAALNALLNKMLQDPSKLIRISALSAFGSQLASGNDYTVKLLQNIQKDPNADKEDVLQAADILLKMSAGVEAKNIPNPEAKKDNDVNNEPVENRKG